MCPGTYVMFLPNRTSLSAIQVGEACLGNCLMNGYIPNESPK